MSEQETWNASDLSALAMPVTNWIGPDRLARQSAVYVPLAVFCSVCSAVGNSEAFRM